jgi:hypothetical protein
MGQIERGQAIGVAAVAKPLRLIAVVLAPLLDGWGFPVALRAAPHSCRSQ